MDSILKDHSFGDANSDDNEDNRGISLYNLSIYIKDRSLLIWF